MKRLPRFVFAALSLLTATILVWAGFVAARGVVAAAQSQTAETKVIVRGIITDKNDARIVGASLQFSSGGVKFETITDRAGSYEIRLRPGLYDILVKANGFERIHKEQFEVRPGSAIDLNLNLKMVSLQFIDPISVEPSSGADVAGNRDRIVRPVSGRKSKLWLFAAIRFHKNGPGLDPDERRRAAGR